MADDGEKRRLQDQRDLEFFSKRVMPTASDLLRTTRFPYKYNTIGFSSKKSLERSRRHQTIDAPASLGEVLNDDGYRRDEEVHQETVPSVQKAETGSNDDPMLPLVAAIIVLILLAWGEDVGRLPAALVF